MQVARVLMGARQNYEYLNYPGVNFMRSGFWILGLLGIFLMFFAIPGRTSLQFLLPLALLSGSVFAAEAVLILAKLPTYYLGWNLIYIFGFGFLISECFRFFVNIPIKWPIQK